MATEYEGLIVKFGANTKALNTALKNTQRQLQGAQGKSNNTSKAMQKGFTKTKAVILATAVALGSVIKKSLQLNSTYEQLSGGVEKIFGAQGAQTLQNYAEQFQTIGINANELLDTSTQLGASMVKAFGGDGVKAAEMSAKAIQDITDNASIMGTDVDSITNAYKGFAKQTYTMLDNLKLGYGGTKTEMERLLSDAEKISGVKYDITNLGDITEAVHVIQNDLNITGNASKEASKTIEGSFNQIKASWQNLMLGLGTGNTGTALNGLIEGLKNTAKNIIPVIKNIFTSIGTVLNSADFTGAISDLIGSIIAELPQLATSVFNGLAGLMQSVVKMLPTLITQLTEGILTVLPDLMKGISTLFDGILTALPTLINSLAENLPVLIMGIITELPDLIKKILSSLTKTLPTIIQAVTKLITAIVEVLPDIVNVLADMIPDLIDGLIDVIPETIPALITAFVDLFVAVAKATPQIVGSLISAIWKILQKLPEQIKNLGGDIITGLWNGIKENLGKLVTLAVDVGKTLLNGVKNFLGIGSPSKEFAKIGKWSVKGLTNALSKSKSSLKTAGQKMAYNVVQSAIKTLKAGLNAYNKIVDQYNELKDALQWDSGFSMSDYASSGYNGGIVQYAKDVLIKVKEFAGLLKKLAKAGIPQGLITEIASLGTGGIGVAKEILSLPKSQLKELKTTFNSINSTITASAKSVAKEYYNSGITAGKNFIKGLKKILGDKKYKLLLKATGFDMSSLKTSTHASNSITNAQTYTVNVNAEPGMNTQQLARQIGREFVKLGMVR